ncbi:hypothetical protein BDZ97DRAFT_1979464 [Flammula alnicola]|nr:hypothetical protein BDZ97DRAFT_1979464 [Flammula alnicola]
MGPDLVPVTYQVPLTPSLTAVACSSKFAGPIAQFAYLCEDIKTKHLDDGVMNAPPLKLENLLLTEDESKLMDNALVHTVLSVIVRYGGDEFKHWKEELEKDVPKSSETIAIHKTTLHPLPSMEIDENTITGNIQIIEEINAELKLNPENPEYQKYIKFIAGDQLTIARQRAITGIRLGHEVGLNMWKHFVLVTGLFHAKIADTHGTLLTHFGVSSVRSPGSLAWHNTCLERIPIVLTSLPSFRICRDLIMISLYARILHCLLLVSGEESLEDYARNAKSWATMKSHAKEILAKFANADRVQELRELRIAAEKRVEADEQAKAKRKKADAAKGVSNVDVSITETLPAELQGDMVFENGCLFLQDALLTRLFADAVQSGDSGLAILVLKQWSFSYRGNGRMKYAHEMLHLLHNLINVWTKEIRAEVFTLPPLFLVDSGWTPAEWNSPYGVQVDYFLAETPAKFYSGLLVESRWSPDKLQRLHAESQESTGFIVEQESQEFRWSPTGVQVVQQESGGFLFWTYCYF